MIPIINKTNHKIYVNELLKIIPSDKKIYTLPDKIAYKLASQGVVDIINPNLNKLNDELSQLKEELNIVKNEKDTLETIWKLVKNRKINKKIDMIYPFDFKDKYFESAINRLNWSLKSIYQQNVNICVYVTSDICIKKYIKYPVNYIHDPLHLKYYSRSKTINLAVKNFVNSEYFLVSDIDLIYHNEFINNVVLLLNKKNQRIRIIFYNVNLNSACNIAEPTFENCQKIWSDHYYYNINCRIPEHGMSMVPFPATGNGLFHKESFNKIGGFCEQYIGWGPEDWHLLHDISKINEIIKINKYGFNTFHQYHPRIQCVDEEYKKISQKNDIIFKKLIKNS